MNKCGYVAVIGKPNVGKSTLVNHIVGEKVSIVTAKPQTTRHQILAIATKKTGQILFIDTPGMHVGHKKALNKFMNKTAANAVLDVDLILFMVEAMHFSADDEQALKALEHSNAEVFLLINKADLIKQKERLLDFATQMLKHYEFAQVFYIAAAKGKGIQDLESKILQYLPESENLYADDQLTDKSTRYMVSELIREQLMLRFHQELPYSLTVEVESMQQKGQITHIHALIWVEREIQKNMLIGKGGESMKHVGIHARKFIQELIGNKVNLKLWVKVKSAWADNDRLLQQLGYKHDF